MIYPRGKKARLHVLQKKVGVPVGYESHSFSPSDISDEVGREKVKGKDTKTKDRK